MKRTRNILKAFFLNICLMPQFTLFCGKEIFQEGVSIKRIIQNVKNYEKYIYINASVKLSDLSITDLTGINQISFRQKKQLNLKNNSIEDLTPLTSIISNTLEEIFLQDNCIKEINEIFFSKLQSNFQALECINLSNNPLDNHNKKMIKRWKRNEGWKFKIIFKEKPESDDSQGDD